MEKAISLHLLAVRGLQIVIVIFTVQTVAMARTKQRKWRADSNKELKLARRPSKWGTAASGVTHRPPVLPARTDNTSGNPSYKGMS